MGRSSDRPIVMPIKKRNNAKKVNHRDETNMKGDCVMDLSENIEAAAAELEQTLLDDLTARGLVQPIYVRKAKEYANFWRQKAALDLDVEERGVMVWDEKRKALVDNPAVGKAVQIANMMQAIFRDLGFKNIAISAATSADNGGGSDDLLD